MTDEYKFLPEDILREISSFYPKPQPRISSMFKEVEEFLIPMRISYLDRLYPGWNKRVDVFSYTLKDNVFEKVVAAHDLDSIALVLTLHSNPSAVATALIYQATKQEAVDVLQFLVQKQRKESDKQHIRRKIIRDLNDWGNYNTIPLFVAEDYPLEQIIYDNLPKTFDETSLLALMQDKQTRQKFLDLVSNTRNVDDFNKYMKKLAKYSDYTSWELETTRDKFMRNTRSF